MASLATRLLTTRVTRFVLAALAFACFAAGEEAKAGCGEHVVVMSNLSPEQRSFFIRVLIRGGCQSLGQGSGHAELATAPRCGSCPLNPLSDGRCRGPYCSNERPHEGTPVSPAPRGFDPWSLLVQIINLQELTCAGYIEPADAPLPIARTDSIFHPPRTA